MIKNILKTGAFAAAVMLAAACDDSKYNPEELGPHAFLVESMQSSGIAGKTVTIMLSEKSTSFQLTAALTDKVDEDVKYRLAIDEQVLKTYGDEQGSEYELLSDELYDLGGEIVIPAGSYSASPVTVTVNQLPADMKGIPLALPLKLEKVSGNVEVTSKTSAYVCVVASESRDEFAYFKGASGLNTGAFVQAKQFPNFTIEIRFQMSDFGIEGPTGNGRNRDVFSNGNKVLCRFEDPQTTNASDPCHSQIQFQADGFQNPADGNHFETNKWQHFAVTYDGTDVTLYYNGVNAGVGAGAKSHTPESIGDCIFNNFSFMGGSSGDGGHGTGPVHWGQCKILCTEARVWSVCRTADQIVNNIKSVSPKAKGLEGYWRMSKSTATQDGGTTVFADLTGKGNDLRTSYSIVYWPETSTEAVATDWPE